MDLIAKYTFQLSLIQILFNQEGTVLSSNPKAIQNIS